MGGVVFMYNDEQIFTVLWGTIAGLLYSFRSRENRLEFEHIKILRIVRIAEFNSRHPTEGEVNELTVGKLSAEAKSELLRTMPVTRAKIERLEDLGYIEKKKVGRKRLVALTGSGRALLDDVERSFSEFFDGIAVLRSQRGPSGVECKPLTDEQLLLFDPMHPRHKIPPPGHREEPLN